MFHNNPLHLSLSKWYMLGLSTVFLHLLQKLLIPFLISSFLNHSHKILQYSSLKLAKSPHIKKKKSVIQTKLATLLVFLGDCYSSIEPWKTYKVKASKFTYFAFPN